MGYSNSVLIDEFKLKLLYYKRVLLVKIYYSKLECNIIPLKSTNIMSSVWFLLAIVVANCMALH